MTMITKQHPKQPVIRKGQKKPFRKCSKLEYEQRTEHAVVLLGRRVHRMELHAIFEKEYGLSWRQCETYIAHARKRLIEASGKSKEDHRLDSLNTYLSVIRDSRSKPSDIIAAQRCIDDLLGLKSAAQLNVTGNTSPQASGIFILPSNGREKEPFDHEAFIQLQEQLFAKGHLPDAPHPNGDTGNGQG